MDSVNVAASYGAPAPARVAADASVSILRKAIDTAKNSAEQLVDSIPTTGDLQASATATTANTPLSPMGSIGRNLDLRL